VVFLARQTEVSALRSDAVWASSWDAALRLDVALRSDAALRSDVVCVSRSDAASPSDAECALRSDAVWV
jgi:hypothetical protein